MRFITFAVSIILTLPLTVLGLTDRHEQAIRQFLSQQTTIRVLISAANGFGHQAASLNLMTRLRELGYENEFEVLYEAGMGMKLQSMIPGFRASGPQGQRLKKSCFEVQGYAS